MRAANRYRCVAVQVEFVSVIARQLASSLHQPIYLSFVPTTRPPFFSPPISSDNPSEHFIHQSAITSSLSLQIPIPTGQHPKHIAGRQLPSPKLHRLLRLPWLIDTNRTEATIRTTLVSILFVQAIKDQAVEDAKPYKGLAPSRSTINNSTLRTTINRSTMNNRAMTLSRHNPSTAIVDHQTNLPSPTIMLLPNGTPAPSNPTIQPRPIIHKHHSMASLSMR